MKITAVSARAVKSALYIRNAAAAAILAAVLLSGRAVLLAAPGTVISSVTRLDLRQGRISGEKAYYYMDIPELWQAYLLADREKPGKSGGPVETLSFYYQPQDNITKPIPVLDIAVYDKAGYSSEPDFAVFVETRRYYFAFSCPGGAELPNEIDRAIVGQILARASDDIFLSSLIWPPSDDEKIYTNTLWVNGRQLRAYPFKRGNVTYLPIRDVCEALGYRVGWIEESRAVTLAKGSEYFLLPADRPSENNGYFISIKDDRAYISSLYFATHLKVNIQVDERANVTVY